MKTYSKISGDPKKVWDEVEVQSLNLTEFAVMNSVALTPVTPSEIEANINIEIMLPPVMTRSKQSLLNSMCPTSYLQF